MKTILSVLLILSTSLIFAQQASVWQGGTPGRENIWKEARNWSNHRVPSEFSNVIIPDVSTSTLAAPIIADGLIEVNSLILESNALLTVKKTARVIVYEYTEGINQHTLILEGSLILDELFQEVPDYVAKAEKR